MIKTMRFNSLWIRLAILVISSLLFCITSSCKNNTSKQAQAAITDSVISAIDNVEQYNKIMETSGERLLMFYFYADWCRPCKEFAPVLENIAKENIDSVTVYKINMDKNKDLAYIFRARGIPHVAYVKNKEILLSLTGLYPKNVYLKAIKRFSPALKT
jgi:thioredoxin-like negative regulator of GroEL